MNSEQPIEKNATYKKYAKYIGKLFWEKSNDWDYQKQEYKIRWNLVMIAGVSRRWGRGQFVFSINDLRADDWRRDYSVGASRIIHLMSRGHLIPVDPANPVPPVVAES